MAELKFKGKKMVWNHHLSVPYHTLDEIEKLGYKTDKANGNLIVEGDNLPALKSLLPQYAGKIKCIYIDPPYNTGNEGWVYNDNVNSPLIKEWLGKQVGTDDMTRHDKWLSMMTPRLKIMKELLSDEGVIFISIDNDEMHHLRCLMDEIFGEENFIENLIWQKKYSPQNDAKYFSDMHDFIICFAKSKIDGENAKGWERNLLPRTEEMNSKYSNPDNDSRGEWMSDNLSVKRITPKDIYAIVTPSGREVLPPQGNSWRVSKENFKKMVDDNRIWFGKEGNNVPRIKRFLSEVQQGIVPVSILFRDIVGDNQEAKREINELFPESKTPFDTPKPTRLIKHLITIATEDDDYILDAFAGSGTTAQAVLELNDEDGGNRKFIMIQMPENSDKEPNKNICIEITRERIVKVIENKLENKDVGFEYRKVGQPIDAETILSGQLPTFEQLAKYVFYLATGQTPKKEDISQDKHIAGKIGDTSVYLLYEDSLEELQRMALTHDFAKDLPKGKKIVYAPACFLDDDYLSENDIRFVSIPYNLFERPE